MAEPPKVEKAPKVKPEKAAKPAPPPKPEPKPQPAQPPPAPAAAKAPEATKEEKAKPAKDDKWQKQADHFAAVKEDLLAVVNNPDATTEEVADANEAIAAMDKNLARLKEKHDAAPTPPVEPATPATPPSGAPPAT